jgi:hypothetical protein
MTRVDCIGYHTAAYKPKGSAYLTVIIRSYDRGPFRLVAKTITSKTRIPRSQQIFVFCFVL